MGMTNSREEVRLFKFINQTKGGKREFQEDSLRRMDGKRRLEMARFLIGPIIECPYPHKPTESELVSLFEKANGGWSLNEYLSGKLK